jgi:hypothetical protein
MVFSPSHTLSPPPTSPTSTDTSDRTCSTLLFSDFVKEKKWYFCLLMVATQGVSLWHFHVYMYYNLNGFIASIFLLSTLVSFLMVISIGLKILKSFLCKEYINHIHFLNFLFLLSPSCMWPSLEIFLKLLHFYLNDG